MLDPVVLSIPIIHLLFFSRFIYFTYICEYTVNVVRHTRRGHRISLQMVVSHPCGCWELNSEPLEEQPVLLTTEPSLQPEDFFASTLILPSKWNLCLHKGPLLCFRNSLMAWSTDTFLLGTGTFSPFRVHQFLQISQLNKTVRSDRIRQ